MPKSSYTITFFFTFLIVTAVLQWWQMSSYPMWIWWSLGGICTFIIIIALIGRVIPIVRPSFVMLLFCVPLGVSFSFLRLSQTTHVTKSISIESFAEERDEDDPWRQLSEVTLHGIIVNEPDRRPLKTKYTVEVDEIIFKSHDDAVTVRRHDIHGKVLITDHAMYPSHAYGDEVLVTGVLEKPGKIETFHYDRYLSRYGIYAVMYRVRVQTLRSGYGNSFFAFLYDLKSKFEFQINRLYPEPHASFMAGLLTGSRRGIPEHLLADFQITGLTHIIAISGYNIVIVISVISGALFFLPLKWRFFPSAFAIIAFTLFVGASPSVVRASVMGILGLLALQTGRQKHALIAILFTAFLMTAWNPKVLWYDAGFQLSFLSVLGLSYLSPIMDPVFKHVPRVLGLRESLQMTIAAQLTAVPFIVLFFGHFSLIAPLANVVVAPFIPLAMLFGFLGTCIAFISESLGILIAYPGWGALQCIIIATRFFSDVPHALLVTGSVSAWWIGGYYVVLIVSVWGWMKIFPHS